MIDFTGSKLASFVLITVFLSAFQVIFPLRSVAQGNLLIMPKRIVFNGKQNIKELSLANTGNDTARYLISTIEYRMKTDGSFEPVTEPDSGQLFAGKYLRFFPRSVVLGPKEVQVIRIQLRNPDQLKSGEYRSHLYFRAVPDTSLPEQGDRLKKQETGFAIKLTPVFGVTIPVIIDAGNTSAKVILSNLYLNYEAPKGPELRIQFNRTGNKSVYGEIKVIHITSDNIETVVGIVRGVAIYTPNDIRILKLDLERKDKVNFRQGKLRIEYISMEDGNNDKLSEAELLLK